MAERIPHRRHRIPYVETYEVTEDELQAIEQGSTSRQYDIVALSVAVTTFLSFLAGYLALPPGLSLSRQIFIAILVTSGAAIFYLYGRWNRVRQQDRPMFQRIRERAIGPVGEEGKEISPKELQDLPSASETEREE